MSIVTTRKSTARDQVRLMVTYAYDDLIVRDDTDRHRIERDVMILVLQRDT